MSRIKFKFSKTIHTHTDGSEVTFEASEADSWEEAQKVVGKGVYDWCLENQELKKQIAETIANSVPPTNTKNPEVIHGTTATTNIGNQLQK